MVLKHVVLIIGEDMNVQIGKNVNNKLILQYSSNRTEEHLTDFIVENKQTTSYLISEEEGKLCK